MKCDICGSVDSYVKEYTNVYNIKGKEIKFNSKRRFCSKCNNLIYDDILDNETSIKAIDLYNKLYGIEKEKITSLRKQYNLSQELFSKVIGCAKKTLISYEKGTTIANDTYLIIIKSLINNPSLIKNIISANKVHFTKEEYNKIEKKVSKFLENNEKQLIFNEEFTPTIYNGYTKLNKDKIYNIIIYLSDKTIYKTKLLKELFYIDFLFYKKNIVSLTGLEYAKLKFGPVPDKFETILMKSTMENYVDYDLDIDEKGEHFYIKAKKEFDKNIFTKSELEVIKKVKEYFEMFSVKDIVEYSHKESAYINTKKNELISYDYAFDINLNK